MWSDLRQGRGIGAVIDGLVGAFGTSLSQLPHFAVMYTEADGGARVAVRGPVEARVFTPDSAEPRVVSGLGVATWNERTLAEATSGELSVPGMVAEPVLPITEGVVLAGRVGYVFADPAAMLPVVSADTTEEAEPIGVGAEELASPSPAPEIDAGAAVEPDSVPVFEAPKAVLESSPEPAPDSLPDSDPQSSLGELFATETAPPDTPPEEGKEPARTAETMLTEAVPTEYDQLLFGETVLSSVESAAVRVADHDDEPPASSGMPVSRRRRPW